jgi:hypothetical protein
VIVAFDGVFPIVTFAVNFDALDDDEEMVQLLRLNNRSIYRNLSFSLDDCSVDNIFYLARNFGKCTSRD